MRTCQNCGSQITCGCQEKVASNGKKVCSSCITSYEQNLAKLKKDQNDQTLSNTQQG